MIVLDTDVLIDLVDQREPAFGCVARHQRSGEVIGTTSSNSAELLRGVPPRSRASERVAAVIAAVQEVPSGPRASRRFGTIMLAADRSGTPLAVVAPSSRRPRWRRAGASSRATRAFWGACPV